MSSPRRRSLIPQSIAGRMALCLLLVALFIALGLLMVSGRLTLLNNLMPDDLALRITELFAGIEDWLINLPLLALRLANRLLYTLDLVVL